MDKRQVLEKAIETVADRGVPYGGAENNFSRIAHIWNGLMLAVFGPSAPQFEPHHVSMFMAGMKLGRLAGNPQHADSWIDGAGYFACGGEVALGAPAVEPDIDYAHLAAALSTKTASTVLGSSALRFEPAPPSVGLAT